MKPLYVLTDAERDDLHVTLSSAEQDPYRAYASFSDTVARLAAGNTVPSFLREVCALIRSQRESGASNVHALRNCPIDSMLPALDPDDPVADKHAKKKTFVGETFLGLFGYLTGTPLMAYGSRNNGDFFTDVVAINRYRGMQTGFSDSELVYHNDRTAHWARADYIALLGLRCPDDEVIYTSFLDGRQLLAHIDPTMQAFLRKPYFITPFDPYSRDTNSRQTVSEEHAILERSHSFRYVETRTTVAPGVPSEAKDALIAMKNALILAEKQRHRVVTGDLLTFANQDGLHSRDKMEIGNSPRDRSRWLLKTYSFRDQATADGYADRWLGGTVGCIAD